MEVATHLILNHFQDENDVIIFYFGSRANGKFTRRSDLDVGIWKMDNSHMSLVKIGLLKEILEESIVPFGVDLVDFSFASFEFKKKATVEIKIIQGTRSDFEKMF